MSETTTDNQLDLARKRNDYLEAKVRQHAAAIARKARTSLFVIVTDLEVEPLGDAVCLSCEGPVDHPFLRVMATGSTEEVPAGTVGDECSICARRYGRWGRRRRMSECVSHHYACECREALLAELKAEVDQLRARVAQLEGADPLDVFRPGGA